MGTLSFYQVADMLDPFIFFGQVSSATASSIYFSDNSGNSGTCFGSFSYNAHGLAGGTVTGYNNYRNDTLDYTARNFSLNVLVAKNYLLNGDAVGLQRYALAGNDVINGSVGSDSLLGWGGKDILNGGNGDDTLRGGAGNDTMNGGAGNDTMNGGEGSDVYIIEAGSDHTQAEIVDTGATGIDEVRFAATAAGDTLTLFADDIGIERVLIGTGTAATALVSGTTALNIDASAVGNALTIIGNAGYNMLAGTAYSDNISGRAGDDTLNGSGGNDTLIGGSGSDSYVVDNLGVTIKEVANGGTDTIQTNLDTYALGANLENLTYTGSGTFTGTGNIIDNVIMGGSNNDTLDGGQGKDTLTGGAGNDIFVFDTAPAANNIDTITDFTPGSDQLHFNLTKFAALGTPGALDPSEILSGPTVGAKSATTASEHLLYNTLTGVLYYDASGHGGAAAIKVAVLAGHPALTAADIQLVSGSPGNDIYVIHNISELATVQNPGGGIDTLQLVFNNASTTTPVTVDLSVGATPDLSNFQNVTVMGTGLFNVTGNNSGGILKGNASANVLQGGLGNDSLNGGAGNDTLNGSGGNDTLIGGSGNDTYVVDNLGVTVKEVANGGTDTIQTNLATYSLGANLENLAYEGAGAFKGTGNNLNNNITGGAGNDSLNGRAGNDTLIGGGGKDTLIGGAGNDTYLVDNLGVTIKEVADGGADTIQANLATYTLGANLENLVYTGSGTFTGTGNSLNNIISGGTGNDNLNGRAGNDTMNGGAGNDTMDGGEGSDVYVIEAGSDHSQAEIADTGATGIDEVRFAATAASDTLTLFANDIGIERVVIGTGTAATALATGTTALNIDASAVGNALTIIGNAGDNMLTGTAYSDSILGGAGNDVLSGGGGADQFYFTAELNASANVDTILDFNDVNGDLIMLSSGIFTALSKGVTDVEIYSGKGLIAAATVDQHLIYNSTTGNLYYDADGVGGKGAILFATIDLNGQTANHPGTLTAADFWVIA
jgi:Ca2+-binding RTX toxin-like protein